MGQGLWKGGVGFELASIGIGIALQREISAGSDAWVPGCFAWLASTKRALKSRWWPSPSPRCLRWASRDVEKEKEKHEPRAHILSKVETRGELGGFVSHASHSLSQSLTPFPPFASIPLRKKDKKKRQKKKAPKLGLTLPYGRNQRQKTKKRKQKDREPRTRYISIFSLLPTPDTTHYALTPPTASDPFQLYAQARLRTALAFST